MTQQPLPETHKGLVVHEPGKPLSVEDVPTPQAYPGSVVVKILFANADADFNQILAGITAFFKFPTPFILGNSAVARVAATGPDATTLQVGQLVVVEGHVRARDDPDNVQLLYGMTSIITPGPVGEKFMAEAWPNGTYAEYARLPLENCYPVNEKLLTGSIADGGLGYEIADLAYIAKQMVPMGGFASLNLKAGETVVIAPATGAYSGCAVEVAAAMGARVIACGRNTDTLKRLKDKVRGNVQTYQLTGDVDKDAQGLSKFGQIDAFLEFSPFGLPNGNHILSAIKAIRPYGRMAFMGTSGAETPIVFKEIMEKKLTLTGQYMYERADARRIIKMVETGSLKLGKSAGLDVRSLGITQWKEALELAEECKPWGACVLLEM